MQHKEDEVKRHTSICMIVALFIALAVGIPHTQKAFADEKIQVIKISSQDNRAVVKTSDGILKVIKVGDSLEGLGAIVEIAQGRIVLETKGDKGIEQVIIRLEKGIQTIERVHTVDDTKPPAQQPITRSAEEAPAKKKKK